MTYYNNSFNHETNIIQSATHNTVIVNTRRSLNTYEYAIKFIEDLEAEYTNKVAAIRQAEKDKEQAKIDERVNAMKRVNEITEKIKNLVNHSPRSFWSGTLEKQSEIDQLSEEKAHLINTYSTPPSGYRRSYLYDVDLENYEREPRKFSEPWLWELNHVTKYRNILSVVETERVKVTHDEAAYIASINYGIWQENLMKKVKKVFGE